LIVEKLFFKIKSSFEKWAFLLQKALFK